MFVVKECTKCNEYKLLSYFNKDNWKTFGVKSQCKACFNEHQRQYYESNKEHVKGHKKQYYQANKGRINDRMKGYFNQRRKTDSIFKLSCGIRNLISSSISRNGYTKRSKTQEILGCDFETFKLHIEKQFKKGMTWENRNEWHLDHIYPVSLAKDEQHLIELNHYTNFQPLWAKENMSKGKKIVKPIQVKLTI